jgi:hypothetical protein
MAELTDGGGMLLWRVILDPLTFLFTLDSSYLISLVFGKDLSRFFIPYHHQLIVMLLYLHRHWTFSPLSRLVQNTIYKVPGGNVIKCATAKV